MISFRISIYINPLSFIHSSLYTFPIYLLPESWSNTTTISSLDNLFFNCAIPDIAAPQEYPPKIPSSLANLLVKTAASLSVTFSKWSIILKSTFLVKCLLLFLLFYMDKFHFYRKYLSHDIF